MERWRTGETEIEGWRSREIEGYRDGGSRDGMVESKRDGGRWDERLEGWRDRDQGL